MSSQCAKRSVIVRALTGSFACRLATVWSEKTTPQPKVTPFELRSNTCSSWAGSRSFIRSEEHTSELQSLMRIAYAVFCLKKTTPKSTDSPARRRTTQTPPTVHVTHAKTKKTKHNNY